MLDGKIELFIEKLFAPEEQDAYRYAELLAKENSSEIVDRMIKVLNGKEKEHQYLAAKTLSMTSSNQEALDPLLSAINDKRNKSIQGDLTEFLSAFDCSEKFHQLFKLSLFGSVKAAAMAQEILDFEEFVITPRSIRKAEKHWVNYSNNVKRDDAYELKKNEITAWFEELKLFLD